MTQLSPGVFTASRFTYLRKNYIMGRRFTATGSSVMSFTGLTRCLCSPRVHLTSNPDTIFSKRNQMNPFPFAPTSVESRLRRRKNSKHYINYFRILYPLCVHLGTNLKSHCHPVSPTTVHCLGFLFKARLSAV